MLIQPDGLRYPYLAPDTKLERAWLTPLRCMAAILWRGGWGGGLDIFFFNKVVLEQYFVERRWYAFKSSSCKQNWLGHFLIHMLACLTPQVHDLFLSEIAYQHLLTQNGIIPPCHPFPSYQYQSTSIANQGCQSHPIGNQWRHEFVGDLVQVDILNHCQMSHVLERSRCFNVSHEGSGPPSTFLPSCFQDLLTVAPWDFLVNGRVKLQQKQLHERGSQGLKRWLRKVAFFKRIPKAYAVYLLRWLHICLPSFATFSCEHGQVLRP